MLTRCPACQTLFRIRAETLRVALGQVRCGRCGAEFNALDSLAEDPEELNGVPAAGRAEHGGAPVVSGHPAGTTGAFGPVAEPAPVDTASVLGAGEVSEQTDAGADMAADAALRPAGAEMDGFVGPLPEGAVYDDRATAESSVSEVTRDEDSQAAADGERPQPMIAPELIHLMLLDEESRRSRVGPRAAAALVALLLLATLAGQWLYLQRAPLYTAQPALRPVLERMCLLLDCDLPLARAPERIEVVERIVREHPRVAQALLVDLTFISRAEGRIAYPLLELRLTDLSGNRVAARRFTPDEYLPAPDTVAAGLAAGLPVQVTLELLAPNLEVVSFQFDFL